MKKGVQDIVHGGGWRSSEHADREEAKQLAVLGTSFALLAAISVAACLLGEPPRYSYLIGAGVFVALSIRFLVVARDIWPNSKSG